VAVVVQVKTKVTAESCSVRADPLPAHLLSRLHVRSAAPLAEGEVRPEGADPAGGVVAQVGAARERGLQRRLELQQLCAAQHPVVCMRPTCCV